MCECKETFRNYANELIHFKNIHSITLKREQLEFENVMEFEKWKEEVEETEVVQFFRGGGNQTRKNGKTVIKYPCHRSGYFISKAKVRPVKDSIKINAYCPAKIIQELMADGKSRVFYQKVHVGHTNEIGFLRLSKKERDELAEQISLEIPFKDILDGALENCKTKKKYLVTRKTLYNITRGYNLQDAAVRSRKKGRQSVAASVKKNRRFMCKEQGVEAHVDQENSADEQETATAVVGEEPIGNDYHKVQEALKEVSEMVHTYKGDAGKMRRICAGLKKIISVEKAMETDAAALYTNIRWDSC